MGRVHEAELRRVVAQAMRTEMLLGPQVPAELPPPADLEAEEAVVSALLNGHETLESIAPLVASDFHLPLHRLLVVAVEALRGAALHVNPGRVAQALEAQGYDGARFADEIDRLRRAVPAVVPIDGMVRRVRETAEARRVLEGVSAVLAGLRAGAFDATEARQRLARICSAGAS